MVWKVGTGYTISFWLDNWIGDQSLAQLLDIEDISILDLTTKVSEFIHNAQWVIHKLNNPGSPCYSANYRNCLAYYRNLGLLLLGAQRIR